MPPAERTQRGAVEEGHLGVLREAVVGEEPALAFDARRRACSIGLPCGHRARCGLDQSVEMATDIALPSRAWPQGRPARAHRHRPWQSGGCRPERSLGFTRPTKRSTAISRSRVAGLPELVGRLHSQPGFRGRAEGLRQPDGHLHRNPCSLVHQLRKRLPGNAQTLRGPASRSNPRGSRHCRFTIPPGCGGLAMAMTSFSLVVEPWKSTTTWSFRLSSLP